LRVQLLKQFKLLDMFILISTWTGLKFHRKYFTGFSKKVCYNQCYFVEWKIKAGKAYLDLRFQFCFIVTAWCGA